MRLALRGGRHVAMMQCSGLRPAAGAPAAWSRVRGCDAALLPARCLAPPGAAGGRAGVATAASASATAAPAAGGSQAAADPTGRPKICILGGGFGGLYTAIKLELLMWPQGKKPQITLIDQGERFVFKPLLYELLNGTAQSWEVAPPFSQLLAPYPITFIQDKVVEVQPEELLRDGGSAAGGRVMLASGEPVAYDWLVVALGAAADARGVPGVRECARPFTSLEDAEFVAERLAAIEAAAARGEAPGTLVVVGGGFSGVELAAVVGERLGGAARVVVVTPGSEVLEAAPPGQRQAAMEALRAVGVSVMTGTKVTGIEQLAQFTEASSSGSSAAAAAADTAEPLSNGTAAASSSSSSSEASYMVRLEAVGGAAGAAGSSDSSTSSDSSLQASLVLWTAGSRPASQPLGPFPCDARGQLEADSTLRVVRHARVFALGDIAKGQPEASSGSGSAAAPYYPATAQVAFQQADYAAWNIWSAINGRPLLPFRYQHLGDMMSLGAANAAVALPVQLPSELASSVAGSPLGSLLSLAGVKLDRGVTLEGPLAQLLRRGAYLYRQPTNEQRLSVAASWLTQAADAVGKLAAELSASRSGGGGVAGGR